MKRILLLAAGAIGTAGMIAMAAPASADEAPQPGQNQLGMFRDSIKPNTVVKEFLYGNCGANLADCPEKDPNPGVLNQFDFFRGDLESQSAKFENSINPKKQLESFVKSITTPPSAGENP